MHEYMQTSLTTDLYLYILSHRTIPYLSCYLLLGDFEGDYNPLGNSPDNDATKKERTLMDQLMQTPYAVAIYLDLLVEVHREIVATKVMEYCFLILLSCVFNMPSYPLFNLLLLSFLVMPSHHSLSSYPFHHYLHHIIAMILRITLT